jgi:hypothetical protein
VAALEQVAERCQSGEPLDHVFGLHVDSLVGGGASRQHVRADLDGFGEARLVEEDAFSSSVAVIMAVYQQQQ